LIHELADIEDGAIIGDGTNIWRWTHVRSGARIGKNCTIGQNCYVGGLARIGDGCKIQNNVSVYDAVHLYDNVFVGPSVVFTNVLRPRAEVRANPKYDYKATFVLEGATIGANATIVCGVTIGEYAMVGAGSVVTKDVPDFGEVYGVPAELKGTVTRSGNGNR